MYVSLLGYKPLKPYSWEKQYIVKNHMEREAVPVRKGLLLPAVKKEDALWWFCCTAENIIAQQYESSFWDRTVCLQSSIFQRAQDGQISGWIFWFFCVLLLRATFVQVCNLVLLAPHFCHGEQFRVESMQWCYRKQALQHNICVCLPKVLFLHNSVFLIYLFPFFFLFSFFCFSIPFLKETKVGIGRILPWHYCFKCDVII